MRQLRSLESCVCSSLLPWIKIFHISLLSLILTCKRYVKCCIIASKVSSSCEINAHMSVFIESEASFLVCSMHGFSINIYVSGRTSCCKCSKCFYVYLNIRPMRYSARIESVSNARRQRIAAQQVKTAREQTIATESTEERQTRLQQLRSAQQQRIAAEPQEREARLQHLTTA